MKTTARKKKKKKKYASDKAVITELLSYMDRDAVTGSVVKNPSTTDQFI